MSSIILSLLMCFILLLYSDILSVNLIYSIKDGNEIHLHGHVTLDKETGKTISQSIGNIGNNIGLGASVAGVSAAVAKGISKSAMPPLQKAAAIGAGAVIGGSVHALVNYLNKVLSGDTSTTINTTSSFSSDSSINKFLLDLQLDPLQGILWSIEVIDYACLTMMYLLLIQLIYKLYLKDSVNFNLARYLGDSINDKIEFYLNKMIRLNKRMSITWIWYILIMIVFGLSTNLYVIYRVYINIDRFINTHNPISSNIVPTIYKSIEDALFILGVINFISLVIVISLIIILLFILHFNRRISIIYIWALVIALIITLAYFTYISSDIYTNIDSYINMYNNLEK